MLGRRFVLIGILGVVGWFAGADEPPPVAPPPPPPQSSAARAAVAKYEKAVADADEARRQALVRAKSALLEELKPARGAAMKNNDLKEAVAIDGVGKRLAGDATELAANVPPLPGAAGRERLGRRLAGSTWGVAGGGLRLTFNADRTLGRTDRGHPGKWAPIDDRTAVVLYDEGVIDLFRFDEAGATFEGTAWQMDHPFKGILERQAGGARR